MIPESTLLNFRSLETPFYYYDIDLLNRTLEEVRKHGLSKGYRIHYAIKANFNPELLKYIRQAGLGIDCVSGKEIETLWRWDSILLKLRLPAWVKPTVKFKPDLITTSSLLIVNPFRSCPY